MSESGIQEGCSTENTMGDDEETINTETITDVFDDVTLQTLPQTSMLNNMHGREKAAVMRRNIAGRKKPTRQGLRDSLLKSLDESDIDKMLSSVQHKTLDEEDERDSVVRDDPHVVLRQPAAAESTDEQNTPAVAPHPVTLRTQKMLDLNSDLTNVLRKRQSRIAVKPDSGGERPGVLTRIPSTKISVPVDSNNSLPIDHVDSKVGNSAEHESVTSESSLPSSWSAKLNKPKSTQPDVVPHQVLPDLALNIKDNSSQPKSMETSPEHKPTAIEPHFRPKLKPVQRVEPGPDSTENQMRGDEEENQRATQSNAKDSYISTSSEPFKAPCTPKLRKVETPSVRSSVAPVLPPKPKLKPIRDGRHSIKRPSDEQSGDRPSHERSVPINSLPMKSPQHAASSRPVHLQPIPTSALSPQLEEHKASQSTKGSQNSREPVNSRTHASESPKLRKPLVSAKPDWIEKAAEKRKRASMLIEQAEAPKSLEKDHNKLVQSDNIEEPATQFRLLNRVSRSSSTDSNKSNPAQTELTAGPVWRRELNNHNTQRRADRNRKAQSTIDFTTYTQSRDKENTEDYTIIPPWKRELKTRGSRGSVIGVKDDSQTRNGGGEEPEFIKMFKRRQERLKKAGSLIVESDC